MAKEKKSSVRHDSIQDIQVSKLLDEHCEKRESAPGSKIFFAYYAEGWSDEKITEVLNETHGEAAGGRPFNVVATANLRLKYIGPLPVAVNEAKMAGALLKAEVDELRGRVVILEGMIADLFDIKFSMRNGEMKTLAQLAMDSGGKSDMGKLKSFRDLKILKGVTGTASPTGSMGIESSEKKIGGSGGPIGTSVEKSGPGSAGSGSGGGGTNKPRSSPPG